MAIKTLRVRVKDRHCVQLLKLSQQVNNIWNFINEISTHAIEAGDVFYSGYDLQKFVKGASQRFKLKYPNSPTIKARTIEEVCTHYAKSRIQHKKRTLKFRKTFGTGRALGWVPFKGSGIRWLNGQVKLYGNYYSVIDSYGMSRYKFRAGSFSEDARGRWYFNVMVEVKPEQSKQSIGTTSVGIDLGCKTAATPSRGKALKGRWYRELEPKLAAAQSKGKKDVARKIHAKIKNRRADALHKFSRKLVNENAAIFVGDVNSTKIIEMPNTKLGKSVTDASWYELKRQLCYKSSHAGAYFEVINEAYTTQTCSSCGEIPESSPKGKKGLSVRTWTCDLCNETHDRDVNAAKNIQRLGLQSLSQVATPERKAADVSRAA